jgi:hypothetical protein
MAYEVCPLASIVVKTLPATDTRPQRIKATCKMGSFVRVADPIMDIPEAFYKVARELAFYLRWIDASNSSHHFEAGWLPDDVSMVFVLVPNECSTIKTL